MLTQRQRRTVVESFRLVVPVAETAVELFYRRLFELRPAYRDLFTGDMSAQHRKLISMLSFIVRSLDFDDQAWNEQVSEGEDLFLVTVALGRRHQQLYRVPGESYAVVGEALLWALDYSLGDAFTPEVREAWTEVYVSLSTSMRLGGATGTSNARDEAVA